MSCNAKHLYTSTHPLLELRLKCGFYSILQHNFLHNLKNCVKYLTNFCVKKKKSALPATHKT